MLYFPALCFFLYLLVAYGFSPVVVTPRQNDMALMLAGKPGGSRRGGAPSKGKKNKNKNQKQNKKANSPPSSSRAAQMNNKKKQSSHSPPWQVVSKKDMAKNIQAEKERRTLAQQGTHNVEQDRSFRMSKSFLSNEDKRVIAWKRFASSSNDDIDFIGAYLNKQLPPRLGAPEVAFLGRSNVGKSSLLNKLVGSDTARVGKTPGATASVNLYGIFRKDKAILGLVDLPGFGYAKLSKENKESVQMAAENYLGKRKELFLGILLVDIRRIPSDDDRAVLAALYDMGVPIIVVATKEDKLSKSQVTDSLDAIRNGLGLPEGQPLCVSSVTGHGIKDLWRIIMEACETGVSEFRSKVEKGVQEEELEILPDDDVAYSQGFDWIHDSASVMYEDEGEVFENYDFGEDEEYQEEPEPVQRESIKFLRKKAKEMERRGEL